MNTAVLTWNRARELMARTAAENGSFLVRAVAVGGASIAIAVAGWAVLKAMENGDRLTRLEAQVEVVESMEDGFDRIERAIRESSR